MEMNDSCFRVKFSAPIAVETRHIFYILFTLFLENIPRKEGK